MFKSLLERLALRPQLSYTTPERAFVAGCEFIAAAHNGDLARYFRDSLPDARALADDISACSQQLDAGLLQWTAHLCKEA